MSGPKKIAVGKMMISIGEGCLFRDKVHLVKMGTAADNPTFWYVFRMVIDWTVPKSSTEMRDIILSYCNESMVFEGANKNFSMLEVDFSHHNSVNLAKENTKKQTPPCVTDEAFVSIF